jgi:hypothetical protein
VRDERRGDAILFVFGFWVFVRTKIFIFYKDFYFLIIKRAYDYETENK